MRRQIYALKDTPLTLIIADGSNNPANLPANFRFGNLTINYFWSNTPAQERFSFLAEKVQTEYCTFLDDEDALITAGFLRLLRFLDCNKDFSCAGGQVYEVILDNSLKLRGWSRFSSDLQLEEDNPVNRILKCVSLDRTANICYQITRTSHLRTIPRNVLSVLPDRGVEIFWALSLLAQGKYKKFGDFPYWIRNNLRSTSNPSISSEPLSRDTSILISEQLPLEKHSSRFEIKQRIAKALLSTYGAPNPLSRAVYIISYFFKPIISNILSPIRLFLKNSIIFLIPSIQERRALSRAKKFDNELLVPKIPTEFDFSLTPDATSEIKHYLHLWKEFPDGISESIFTQLRNNDN